MPTFSHPLWGYLLTYPDDWVHQTSGDIEAFAATESGLNTEYAGPQAGHLLTRCEFNHTGENIDPLWNDHLSKLSLMLGAKNVGSSPLAMGGGSGYEAEIVLPKKRNQRLWTGILSHGLTILHLMVAHPLDNRDWFEPLGSKIIASLRFLLKTSPLAVTTPGIPLPPNYSATDPTALLSDIADQQGWQAFKGNASPGALQAFYLRELQHCGWEIAEYVPYPSQTNLNFARFQLHQKTQTATLAILPSDEKGDRGNIVIKNV
jgi:hypothetical protein